MWEVLDVSAWSEVQAEARGVREKVWLRAPKEGARANLVGRWLWKLPRDRGPCEPAIEVFALALARASGLDAAKASLATRTVDGRTRRGIAVRSFIESDDGERSSATQLLQGSRVLGGQDDAYSPSARPSHTVARVRAAIEKVASGALLGFARLLCWDAWVGNGDRHQENWGLVESRDGTRALAPMYDPAACLGAELQPGHALLDDRREAALARYVHHCRSGFGDDVTLIPMARVVEQARDWPEWRSNVDAWLVDFRRALETAGRPMLESAPGDWWPQAYRALACRLLEERLAWLEREARGG